MLRSVCPTRKPSQRPVRRTPLPSASIAERAALMRSMADARSYSGLVASPVESSIDNPATPVLTAAATLAATFSGLWAKPPSKSALTGRSTASQSAVRCCNTSSSVTRLSDLPIDQAKPALVEAIALKPICCSALALPISQGLGSTKHPVWCIFRKVARLSAVVIDIIHSPCFDGFLSGETSAASDPRQCGEALRGHLAQKCPLFHENEPVFLGEIEIGHAFPVGAKPAAIT